MKYLERSHGRLVSPDIDASQVKYGLVSSEYKFVKSIESVVNQQVIKALERAKLLGQQKELK